MFRWGREQRGEKFRLSKLEGMGINGAFMPIPPPIFLANKNLRIYILNDGNSRREKKHYVFVESHDPPPTLLLLAEKARRRVSTGENFDSPPRSPSLHGVGSKFIFSLPVPMYRQGAPLWCVRQERGKEGKY